CHIMENQLQTNLPKFDKLGRYYLIALGAIAIIILLNQVLIQKFISDQENDSHVVNLSGRQRMLSQQISKCVLILGTPIHEEKRKQSLKELEMALQEWIETHQGLHYGSETLIKKGGNSKKIEDLFVPVH